MPGSFPTLEMWDQLQPKHVAHFFSSSPEWNQLDAAVRAFSVDQSNEELFQRLKTATEAFVRLKTAQDGVMTTTRDTNGVITALRAYVSDNPPVMSESAIEAAKEVIQANKQAFFRTLACAQIRYKSGKKLEMAKALHDDGTDFRDSLMVIPQVASAADSLQRRLPSSSPSASSSSSMIPGSPAFSGIGSSVSRVLPSLPGNIGTQASNMASQVSGSMMKIDWDGIIRDICSVGDSIPDVVLHELKELLGRQLFDSISSAIPYLGTIKEGADVMNSLKTIAMHEVNTYRVHSTRSYARPGDVQSSIDAMIRVLNSERVDLGVELAGSSATFTAGIGTLGVDGGALQVITSVAVTGAKLLRTIYSFVADHVAMTKTNQMLKSAGGTHLTLLETLHKFPMLGAHVIKTLETSTVLELNIMEINQPFFKYMTEQNNQKIQTIRETACRIIEDSRFELLQSELATLTYERNKQKFASTLQQQLVDVIDKREINKRKMNAVVRDIPAAAARFQERRDAKTAHVAKFTPVAREAASKLSLLEIMQLANMELEHEMAALIDIQAMEENRQNESRRNKALAVRVQSVLETYKDQTSGFRSLITSQSDESTAAIAALNSFVNATSHAGLSRLRELVEYLLKVGTKVPQGVGPALKQLKDPSRLHGLLNAAYQNWSVTGQ